MTAEYSSQAIRKKLEEMGLDLNGRKIEIGVRYDTANGAEVQIPTVHIPKKDGLPGPQYDIESLFKD